MCLNLSIDRKIGSNYLLFATLQTAAHQAPPSMGFSKQEYRSGLPFLSPGDLSDPGIEPPGLPNSRLFFFPLGLRNLHLEKACLLVDCRADNISFHTT